MPRERAKAEHRRIWVPPALVRHDSMLALTQQYVDPATGEWLDPNNPEHAARLNDIGGSSGFFP